jgi:hypothetical protein
MTVDLAAVADMDFGCDPPATRTTRAARLAIERGQDSPYFVSARAWRQDGIAFWTISPSMISSRSQSSIAIRSATVARCLVGTAMASPT